MVNMNAYMSMLLGFFIPVGSNCTITASQGVPVAKMAAADPCAEPEAMRTSKRLGVEIDADLGVIRRIDPDGHHRLPRDELADRVLRYALLRRGGKGCRVVEVDLKVELADLFGRHRPVLHGHAGDPDVLHDGATQQSVRHQLWVVASKRLFQLAEEPHFTRPSS